MGERLPLGVWVREWRARRTPREREWVPGYRPRRLEIVRPAPPGTPGVAAGVARVTWSDGSVYEYAVEEEWVLDALERAVYRRGLLVNRLLPYKPGVWVRRVSDGSAV